jgi:hypothetical protein
MLPNASTITHKLVAMKTAVARRLLPARMRMAFVTGIVLSDRLWAGILTQCPPQYGEMLATLQESRRSAHPNDLSSVMLGIKSARTAAGKPALLR